MILGRTETVFRIFPLLAPAGAIFLASCAIPEVETVSYDRRHGERTTFDLYLPPGQGEARPAVLLLHGGAWRVGQKAHLHNEALRLARAGYVVANANYRLAPEGEFPRIFQDVQCALSELRRMAPEIGVAPDRVAVFGYSAGGHLASLLGVAAGHPDLEPDCDAGPTGPPAAVIAAGAPQDLRHLADVPDLELLLGASLQDDPQAWALASPPHHITQGHPPFLLVHGSNEWWIPLAHAEEMRDLLMDAGNEADLLPLRGGGHVFNRTPGLGHTELAIASNLPEAWLVMMDFLERTVGPP